MEQSEFLQEFLKQRKMLFAFILAIFPDRHAAEDIFQDVSLIAFNKCQAFQTGTNFGAWLREIARRRAMKQRESMGSAALLLDEESLDALTHAYTSERESGWETREDALRECMRKLPDTGRQIIELRYRDELSFDEIAQRLQSTANSVQVRMTKLRQALRRCMELRLAR